MTVDPRQLHPDGALKRMKELYTARSQTYMEWVAGDWELREECRQQVTCYLCGHADSRPFLKAAGFRYVACTGCGLVYVNPRLRDELIGEFYQSDAYQFMFENMLMKSVDYRLAVVAQRKFDSVARCVRSGNPRVLDVGCGIGEFLSIAKAHGWQTIGIEFSPRAVAFARRNFGLDVLTQPVKECGFAAGEFDLATMWGVLEHLTNPLEVMSDVRQCLADDGLLAVEVPSYDCLLVRYLRHRPEQADRIVDGWGHLMLFSQPLICRMLTESGFEVLETNSLGLDVATMLRYLSEADPVVADHPLYQFCVENQVGLQGYLESTHQADMIRVVARKKGQ